MKKILTFIFLFLMLFAPLIAQKSERVAVAVSQESIVTIYQKGKTLQIQNAPVGEKLQILSIVGVRVYEKRIDSTFMEIPLDLPKGYYIVKAGSIVRKISFK
jgi:hypothetical protein